MHRLHTLVSDSRPVEEKLPGRPDVHGIVRKTVPKDIDEVDLQIGRPGSDTDLIVVYPSDARDGVISFGDYPPPRPVAASPLPTAIPKPSTNPSQIATPPPHLAPLQ
jgi:hypothetical protein